MTTPAMNAQTVADAVGVDNMLVIFPTKEALVGIDDTPARWKRRLDADRP